MIKEKPILFQPSMVLGTLRGDKHQTRRVNGLKKINQFPDDCSFEGFVYIKNIKHAKFWNLKTDETFLIKSPYGDTGTKLWVRENFSYVGTSDPGYLVYQATYPKCAERYNFDSIPKTLKECGERWKPSIHMPRVACRLELFVESIEIQRAQDISEQDARLEGFAKITKDGELFKYGLPDKDGYPGNDDFGWHWNYWEEKAYDAWKKLWIQINGEESWCTNPWVWVIKFMVDKP